jgi:hypothetical protein
MCMSYIRKRTYPNPYLDRENERECKIDGTRGVHDLAPGRTGLRLAWVCKCEMVDTPSAPGLLIFSSSGHGVPDWLEYIEIHSRSVWERQMAGRFVRSDRRDSGGQEVELE